MVRKLTPKTLFWLLVSAAGLINLASWLWIYFKIPAEASPFILHYNIYFGRDVLGERLALFQIPLVGLIILVINVFLSSSLWDKARYFSWLILGTTLALQLFVLYASGIIVYVNT